MPFEKVATAPANRVDNGRPKNFKPSAQQKRIFDALVNDPYNIVVSAGPGCGKTTTLTEGLFLLPRTVKAGFTTFSKAIADSLVSRVPKGIPSATLHSFGNKIVCNALGARPELEQLKSSRLLEKLAPKIPVGESIGICRLVSLCKNLLLTGEDTQELQDLIARFDVEIRDKWLAFEMVPAVLSMAAEETHTIDYDDMIWLPVIHAWASPQFDLLLVDEAQDLNKCQQTLSLAIANRFVYVGDAKQAIYAFRGADSRSMQTMTEALAEHDNSVVTLPLTETRRCPKSHVALIQTLGGELTALDDAPEGNIYTMSTAAALEQYQPGDFILCRTNAPVVATAFALIQRGQRVRIQGRDLGKTLLSLVKRFRPRSIAELCDKLRQYQEREREKICRETKQPEQRLEALSDKCNCLRAIIDGVENAAMDAAGEDYVDGPANIQQIESKITALFTEAVEEGKDPSVILLSSVHRGKGLEAERVFILKPELMPHPMAKKPEDIEQEINCLWVAASRSKMDLTFVGPVPSILNRSVKVIRR